VLNSDDDGAFGGVLPLRVGASVWPQGEGTVDDVSQGGPTSRRDDPTGGRRP